MYPKLLPGLLLLTLMLFLLTGSSCAGESGSRTNPDTSGTVMKIDYLNLPLLTINGDSTTLSSYRGKVVVLVNVASKCGFTPQYKGLEQLYRDYKDKGLVIIGFPANNFMGQEPGTNEEIASFCQTNYDVTFPLMAKISVKGDDAHPLYRYLTERSPFSGEISWNFNKFVLNRDGVVAHRFGTRVAPDSPEFVTAVRQLLGEP